MGSEPHPQQGEAAGHYVKEMVIRVTELLLAALEWGRKRGRMGG